MDQQQFNRELTQFLAVSPTPFHAVEEMRRQLSTSSFVYLPEAETWSVEPGGRYFTTRNGSSIIAWMMPSGTAPADTGFRMVGAHTDSPCLKVKPQPDLHRYGYTQLGVEVYGSALLNPWFDRDLSIAGRVSYLTDQGDVAHRLIDFSRAVAIIPSLAIHLDREANQNRSINAQTYLPPVLGQAVEKPDLTALLHQTILSDGVSNVRKVLDYELFFYSTDRPRLVGLAEEFIASARLDNLLSCFIGLKAMLGAEPGPGALLICNDHEEVGSTSASGARGPMLRQMLERILPGPEERNRCISRSVLISADNAHGIHPNFSDRHGDNHGPILNRGPVIKLNANQRYASNSETGAVFRKLASDLDVPVQAFVARSDLPCGTTIGPLTAAEIGVRTLDVGVPQLAMHSIRELAGTADALNLCKVLGRFYGTPRL